MNDISKTSQTNHPTNVPFCQKTEQSSPPLTQRDTTKLVEEITKKLFTEMQKQASEKRPDWRGSIKEYHEKIHQILMSIIKNIAVK